MPSKPRCRLSLINRSGRKPRLNQARLQRVFDAALAEARITDAALTIMLVADAEASELHGAHFADPTTTDVMTFPDGSDDPASGRRLLGDLAVCVDVAEREAKSRGRPLADELTLYCLHGLLHLIGYDDVTPAKQTRMWKAQRRLLAAEDIAIEAKPS